MVTIDLKFYIYTVILFAAGIICEKIIQRFLSKPDGIFRVNTTDPMKDFYKLEMHMPLGEINKRKSLKLRVILEDSQDKQRP